MTDQLLDDLAERVQEERPRFFAIYGLYEGPCLAEGEDPRYIVWGMEFPDHEIAVTCDRYGQTVSDSAEEMLRTNVKMGPARLVWFY